MRIKAFFAYVESAHRKSCKIWRPKNARPRFESHGAAVASCNLFWIDKKTTPKLILWDFYRVVTFVQMCQVRECDGDKMEDGEYNADRGQKQMLCWIQGSISSPSFSNILRGYLPTHETVLWQNGPVTSWYCEGNDLLKGEFLWLVQHLSPGDWTFSSHDR